jgi:hypothetical protein
MYLSLSALGLVIPDFFADVIEEGVLVPRQLPRQFQVGIFFLFSIYHIHQNKRLGYKLVILDEMTILGLLAIYNGRLEKTIFQFSRKTLIDGFVEMHFDFPAGSAEGAGVRIICDYLMCAPI